MNSMRLRTAKIESSWQIERQVRACHAKNRKAVAFLPFGCTEQHGPFLPLETDTLIADSLAVSISESLRGSQWVYVFPAVPYTPARSNGSYAGTVSVGESVFKQYATAVCESIMKTDFDSLVIVTGHGSIEASLGEICFDIMDRQFRRDVCPVKPVFLLSASHARKVLERKFKIVSGRHADWVELLHLFHILGGRYFSRKMISNIIDFKNKHSFEIIDPGVFGVPVELRSVLGVIGDPAPSASLNWRKMADAAWDVTVRELKDVLLAKMDRFRRIENGYVKE